MPKGMNGFLIAIEGIDGSGKTTQMHLVKQELEKLLNNKNVNVFHEPTKTSKWGKLIRDQVKVKRESFSPREELQLFIDDRKWDLENNVLPALKRDEIVLIDRYYLSNAAYQGALGISLEEILEMNNFAPVPDLWIILDISVIDGRKRLSNREFDELEKLEDLKRVKENYSILASMNIGPVVFVNANQTKEKITIEIVQIILDKINKS